MNVLFTVCWYPIIRHVLTGTFHCPCDSYYMHQGEIPFQSEHWCRRSSTTRCSFFLIFLLVCLGVPASEGMVSVFTFDSVNVILNSTSHGKLRRFYVLLIRQEAIWKMGGGAQRSRKRTIKSLTEATNLLIYRMSALHLVKTL